MSVPMHDIVVSVCKVRFLDLSIAIFVRYKNLKELGIAFDAVCIE